MRPMKLTKLSELSNWGQFDYMYMVLFKSVCTYLLGRSLIYSSSIFLDDPTVICAAPVSIHICIYVLAPHVVIFMHILSDKLESISPPKCEREVLLITDFLKTKNNNSAVGSSSIQEEVVISIVQLVTCNDVLHQETQFPH